MLIWAFACISPAAFAQLTINNAQLFIESGATVTVQGDISSNANIGGTGKILLKGSSTQNVNMNGFTIPNLDIENPLNANLRECDHWK